jgi:putative membrane protein
MEPNMDGLPARPDATQLAVERTRLAHERTLMAWVRTSTSLISFGFTIYKFFQYLRETGQAGGARFLGPRDFALAMIATGLVTLSLATLQHWQNLRILRAQGDVLPRSLAMLLAALILGLGVLSLLAVIFRR